MVDHKNSADKAAVKKAAERDKRKREQEFRDLQTIMNSEHGRRFVRRLVVEFCGRDRSSYLTAVKGSDPVFLEGGRNIGLMLLGEIKETGLYQKWLLAEVEHDETEKKDVS